LTAADAFALFFGLECNSRHGLAECGRIIGRYCDDGGCPNIDDLRDLP
jgi:hypothetical protein